jgi:hypothetical protein
MRAVLKIERRRVLALRNRFKQVALPDGILYVVPWLASGVPNSQAARSSDEST